MGFQSGIKEEKSLKMLWNNFKVAFAMYSKIPMPMADWNKENMKYTFCFFPFIGLVIGKNFSCHNITRLKCSTCNHSKYQSCTDHLCPSRCAFSSFFLRFFSRFPTAAIISRIHILIGCIIIILIFHILLPLSYLILVVYSVIVFNL